MKCRLSIAALILAMAASGCKMTVDGDNKPLTQSNDNTKETCMGDAVDVSLDEKEWTLMIYMAGDNSSSECGMNNILEMESSEFDEENINVVVLYDKTPAALPCNNQMSGTCIYLVKSSHENDHKEICSEKILCDSLGIGSGENANLNMSDPKNLSKFVSYCKEKFPSRHSGLILWGQSNGWKSVGKNHGRSVLFDDSSCDAMNICEVKDGILKSVGKDRLDFIGLDTAFGGETEILYEFRNCADYIFGFIGLGTESGYDYKNILNSFHKSIADGKEFSELFRKYLTKNLEKSFTVVDSNYADEFVINFNSYVKKIAQKIESREIQKKIQESFYSKDAMYFVPNFQSEVYINLFDFFINMWSIDSDFFDNDLFESFERFVVKEGNDLCYPIGIYGGYVDANGNPLLKFDSDYSKSKLSKTKLDFFEKAVDWIPSDQNFNNSFIEKLIK